MNEHDKARPVSGEIMAGARARGHGRGLPDEPADISDAEYETVEPQGEARAPRFAQAEPATGMDSLKAGSDPDVDSRDPRRGGPLFWATGIALVVLAFWVSGGHALVRQAMVAAPAETARPLRIGEVSSRVEVHDGREVLFVDGQAENHGQVRLSLPPIEIVVTANDGAVTRYFLGTSGTELRPGDSYAFSSRLEAPRIGVKTVSVSFLEGDR